MTASLFDAGAGPDRPGAPLAVRLRPRERGDIVGQQHLMADGSPLRRLLDGDPAAAVSVILWGPPGTGKTTLASLVSSSTGRRFVELSAVTAGVKDVREVIDSARNELALHGRGTVLFIDEVHRFSKTQQDALLPAVENGWVTLIAATTENPSFSVVSPLLSRSLVLTLEPLDDADLARLIDRALVDPRGLDDSVALSAEAREQLLRVAGGDARRLLTALEASAGLVSSTRGRGAVIELDDVETAVQTAAVRYDRDGDQHYDVISAFIKSIRGSDVDAALHYLARMIEAGEDPRFIARRLMILASEDIGMADPSALQTAVAAAQAAQMLGMPEGRLTLAHATIHLSLSPKSNAVINAIDAAQADVRSGRIGTVPAHLRDAHYPGARALGHGTSYRYPHDAPGGIVAQQHLPDVLADRRYYVPTEHGAEARWGEVLQRIDSALDAEGSD
ncbi:MAG: replication-associated recombination protein A [Actinomycetales bacterium]|nr:replication-associated recombination protein A [Actinomycetales bacterium]